jgi:hypothetical protein
MAKQGLTESKKAKVVLTVETALAGMITAQILDPQIGAICLTALAGIYALSQAFVDKKG